MAPQRGGWAYFDISLEKEVKWLLKEGGGLILIFHSKRKLSGSSKRGVGLFLSVLIFHSKVRPPYMLYT